jgi:DNA-binding winged helix-turn-helix (wHTH) protein/Tol biopolymer transport system component
MYVFGPFQLDTRSHELRRGGVRIKIQDHPFLILMKLLERPGQLVTREELRTALWSGDTFVDFDTGLNTAVKRLRESLGDSAESPAFVETLPKLGYRFVAPVQISSSELLSNCGNDPQQVGTSHVIRFATFEVDLRAQELRKAGLRLKLTGQPFQVLAILLQQPGTVITREELQKRLWPDTFVDVDNNLTTAINKIREALGDSPENPRFVETLPRRGYRFIGSVNGAMATPESVAVPRPRLWSRLALPALSLGMAAALVLLWARERLGRPAAEPSPSDARVVRLTDLPGLEESPSISPDGRSVAFTAGVGGRRQVFVQLIAGGAPLQITRDAGDHEYPRWSPDSSSIFYFSPAVSEGVQGNIWEISALGGVPRRVVDSVGSADVSPTDGRLAFFRLAKERIQLVATTVDGSKVDVVAEFAPVSYYLYPRWSPDGRWIAFQRGDSVRFDIFVTQSTGGQPRQLTHDNNMMSGFAWLPDSTGIVYSSSRDSTMPYLPMLGMWAVGLRDGSVRRVLSGETSYMNPDISKSGAIVVSRMTLHADIWKFPVDGRPAENVRRGIRVTRQTGHVLAPTASPDDREVAFLSDSGGHSNLWVVATDTGELHQVTHERDPNVAVGAPLWSPNGYTIAFVYSRGNKGLAFGVWLVDSDGSNLRNVANPGQGPAWSRDGRWVYYSTWSGPAATDVALKKVPADGGPAVTVRSERLRNVIGLNGSTLYYGVDRTPVGGKPEVEIHAATPEDGPFRVLAHIPASRVPIWQIVYPALSPDGKWMAQALTDGFTTNLWTLSTTTGEWRQITDFGDRATFIVRRVSWSFDGRSIYAAVAEGDSDIVLLEGLTNVGRQ